MQPTEFQARPGTLYIVATPIGNLRDITLRALDILKSADILAAEDTRVSGGLLAAYGIPAKLFACHEHNERKAAAALVAELQAGRSVAYVSDAGTPGVSDPGAYLVRAARLAGLPVEPIPGPSAAAAALSVAGLDGPWLFHGFLPHKTGDRRRELQMLAALPQALVFYESPHRLLDTVADLAAVLGGARRLFIARELTKRFEECHDGTLGEALDWLRGDENRQRGEFVLVVSGAPGEADAVLKEGTRVLATLLDEGLPASQAARLAARISGAKKNALYDLALKTVTSDE